MKGRIIGSRGSNIRRLQEQTGATISIVASNITIRGTQDQIAAARIAVNQILHPPSVTLTCYPKYLGALIGPRGATIRSLQQSMKARINVDSSSTPCLITISAESQEIVDFARNQVLNIVNPPCIHIVCASTEFLGNLIGPRGSTIKQLQEETLCHIDVDSRSTPATVTITGPNEESMSKAEQRVRRILQPPQTKLVFQTSSRLNRLIGSQGSTITHLQEMTNTRIHIADQSSKGSSKESSKGGGAVVINISGFKIDDVERASKIIRGILEPYVLELSAPKNIAGAIIGNNGEHINAMNEYCNRLISIGKEAESMCDRRFESKIQKGGGGRGSGGGEENPFKKYVEIECYVYGRNPNICERTITISIASNYLECLTIVQEFVQNEINAAVRASDYMGPEGTLLREQANTWSMTQSCLADEAQAAYKVGNREEASRLSTQAREAAEHMRSANLQARDAIYKHRNAGRQEDTFLDLHGLFVNEALYYLKKVLQHFVNNDTVDELECVTGAGHHSPFGIGKIKEAVLNVVESLHLNYKVKNEGSYLIFC